MSIYVIYFLDICGFYLIDARNIDKQTIKKFPFNFHMNIQGNFPNNDLNDHSDVDDDNNGTDMHSMVVIINIHSIISMMLKVIIMMLILFDVDYNVDDDKYVYDDDNDVDVC